MSQTEFPCWGVDSYNPSHLPAPGTGGQTLFDFVRGWANRAPAFWGRYLNTYSYGVIASPLGS